MKQGTCSRPQPLYYRLIMYEMRLSMGVLLTLGHPKALFRIAGLIIYYDRTVHQLARQHATGHVSVRHGEISLGFDVL